MAREYKNLWIGRGYLVADPEVRTMPDGRQVANCRVGCTKRWRDASGEQQESTEWVRIAVFGFLADKIAIARKGDAVHVEGELRTRQWVDQENITRYTTEVIVSVGGDICILEKVAAPQAPPQAAPRTTTYARQVWREPKPADRDIPFMDVPATTEDDQLPF